MLCQPKNDGNTGARRSRRPVRPIGDQSPSPSKCVPEVWKCKRLTEGFLEGITRIHHAAGEKWRRENKNRILRGECLKWAATTIVLDNGGALAERQQSLCSDAKQKLAKACGRAGAFDVFGSCFC